MAKRPETKTAAAPLKPVGLLKSLGPGLVTGAADDDPSGIATYSQVGAQFGYGLAWTMLFSFPLMAVIQSIAARACVPSRPPRRRRSSAVRPWCRESWTQTSTNAGDSSSRQSS